MLAASVARMDALMPRRRKLIQTRRSPVTAAVVSSLTELGLNPVVTHDARPGDRVNCRVAGNAREGEAAGLVPVGYVRTLPDGGVRLVGLRSAHQPRVALALQRMKIPHAV